MTWLNPIIWRDDEWVTSVFLVLPVQVVHPDARCPITQLPLVAGQDTTKEMLTNEVKLRCLWYDHDEGEKMVNADSEIWSCALMGAWPCCQGANRSDVSGPVWRSRSIIRSYGLAWSGLDLRQLWYRRRDAFTVQELINPGKGCTSISGPPPSLTSTQPIAKRFGEIRIWTARFLCFSFDAWNHLRRWHRAGKHWNSLQYFQESWKSGCLQKKVRKERKGSTTAKLN